jgi:hypothetical protein
LKYKNFFHYFRIFPKTKFFLIKGKIQIKLHPLPEHGTQGDGPAKVGGVFPLHGPLVTGNKDQLFHPVEGATIGEGAFIFNYLRLILIINIKN